MTITGIVLCGGPGKRVGGADKPLSAWRGAALIDHVTKRLAGQVDTIVISANRNKARYAAYGTVIPDAIDGYQGPLAGIAACLPHCPGEFAFICPGDAPLLPANVVQRLQQEIGQRDAAVVHDGHRRQNLHLLLRTERLGDLSNYLQSGRRSAHGWLSSIDAADVDCTDLGDAFRNFNAPQDFIDSCGDST